MIKIKIVYKAVVDTDENGVQVMGRIGEPETPVYPLSVHYPGAVKVKIDAEFYTIYEQGDV